MSNIFFFFTIFNCIIVSSILWVITFLGSYYFNNKNNINQKEHFECGFNVIGINLPNITLNFFFSAIFLLLYDLEFIILIPLFFNWNLLSIWMKFLVFIFLLLILFSFILDIESKTIDWYSN